MRDEPTTSSCARLVAAATALLDEREPGDITITDVVKAALLTRPTFYASVGDLPTVFAEAAVARISDALRGQATGEVDPGERAYAMTSAITHILEGIVDHAEFFRRVLTGHGGHIVQARIVDLLAEEIRTNTPISAALARGPVPVAMSSRALAASVAWTMLDWFTDVDRRSVPELTEILRDLVHLSVVGGLGVVDDHSLPVPHERNRR